ncbi:hypothetical protein ARMSODRAFT_1035111 [Armillaria solidipes]|uniref:Uncharacterized protein n=1 Tax=Armillaria solidipes TaxID=1076256 RepID=A0A2H3BI24_9AGAR|nr:hypothetical protein ARMSODRAFT_1035111 [Armillaria solidipes]
MNGMGRLRFEIKKRPIEFSIRVSFLCIQTEEMHEDLQQEDSDTRLTHRFSTSFATASRPCLAAEAAGGNMTVTIVDFDSKNLQSLDGSPTSRLSAELEDTPKAQNSLPSANLCKTALVSINEAHDVVSNLPHDLKNNRLRFSTAMVTYLQPPQNVVEVGVPMIVSSFDCGDGPARNRPGFEKELLTSDENFRIFWADRLSAPPRIKTVPSPLELIGTIFQ